MPPTYLSPQRYHAMGSGVDLSEVEDQDLAAMILGASALVNSFCNVPITYDFRGGTVTDEPHVYKMWNHMHPGSPRVFPDHSPLKELSSFRIQVTNTQYLDVATDRVFYDSSRNLLEPVIAAASIGVWSYSAIPVAGFREPIIKVSYTYGDEFPVIGERLFPDGGAVWRAQNQWWTDEDDVEITVAGITLDPGDYTVDLDEGTVSIDDDALTDLDISDAEADEVRASYTHKLPTSIMLATSIITTSLLGQRNIVAKGLQGLSGIRVEEVEIRQSRDAQAARDSIPGLAQTYLTPFKRLSWGHP